MSRPGRRRGSARAVEGAESSSSPTRSASRRRGPCGGSWSACRSPAAGRRAPAQHAQHRLRERLGRARGGRDASRRVRRWSRRVPFAPSATGNIATEDLVYLLERDGRRDGRRSRCPRRGVALARADCSGRRSKASVYRAGALARRRPRRNGLNARSISSSPVCQFETETRIACARPTRAAHPDSPPSCTRASTASVCCRRRSGRAPGSARRRSAPRRRGARDRSANRARSRSSARPARRARSAERAQRRVDRETARAARELGHPVDLVAHARAPSSWIRYDGARPSSRRGATPGARRTTSPESYGTLSHLWRPSSTSPRARRRDEVASPGRAAAQSPNAPSTCSHAPAPRQRRRSRANGSNAPVFTSPACAQTIVGPSSRRAPAQRVRDASVPGRRRRRARRAEPEQAQRAVDRHVALLADEHAHRAARRSARRAPTSQPASRARGSARRRAP